MSGTLLRKSRSCYTVLHDDSILDIYRHFTSRGHVGPVQALDATEEADYYISGGFDGTMRVWRYAEEYDAYALAAVLHCSRAVTESVEDGEEPSLCAKLKALVLPKAKDWCASRQGVTAVAHVSSTRAIFMIGETVELDLDADYVKEQFDYIDFVWDDGMENMLGETFAVVEAQSADVIGLPAPEGAKEKVWYFPTTCVTRSTKLSNRNGPFLSATASGDLCALCLWSHGEGRVVTLQGLHEGAVNEICVVPVNDERTEFMVVTASDDGECAMMQMECEEVQQPAEETAMPEEATPKTCLALVSFQAMQDDGKSRRMKHDSEGAPTPVLSVKSVGADTNTDLVTFVTLTRDGAHLWNIQGQAIMRLTVQKQVLQYNVMLYKDDLVKPEIAEYTSLACVNKENGSLIFLAGGGYTAVWSVQDGMVSLPLFKTLDRNERLSAWQNAVSKFKTSGTCPAPTATYSIPGRFLDVDHSLTTTRFVAELEGSYRVVLWDILAIDPDFLAVEPPGPDGLLVMPGRERVLMGLRHAAKVHSLRVIEEVTEEDTNATAGPSALVGCENGTVYAWDVEGKDRRQIHAQLRSLSLVEIFLPVALLVVSTVQFMSFAFGPSIKWSKEVDQPANVIHNFMMLDFKFAVKIDKALIFWPEIGITIGLMVFFIVFAITGMSQLMEALVYEVQNSRCFKAEDAGGSIIAPCHWLLKLFRKMKVAVSALIQLASTLLVVPMFQTCAQAVDCVHPEDGEAHLAWASTIKCGEGPQLTIQIILFFLLPCYFVVLVPFAACSGDAAYVPRSTLYDYKFWEKDNMWRKASMRKATDVHLGLLHPVPQQAFSRSTVELMAKIFLPIVTTLTTYRPIFQMATVSAVGILLYVQSLVFKPYLEHKFLVLVQDLRLCTMCSMLCGLMTTIVNHFGHTEAILPFVILVTVVVLTAGHLTYVCCVTPFRRMNVRVYEDVAVQEEPGASEGP